MAASASSAEVAASAAISTTSLLVDTLSPEVRIPIWREVLRCNHALVEVHEILPWRPRFETSLLRTCKTIYFEASDVFFQVNRFRLREPRKLRKGLEQTSRWTLFVRTLELVITQREMLVNGQSEFVLSPTTAELVKIVDSCSALPRLESLTIACDAACEYDLSYLRHVSISSIHCKGVGLFQWERESSPRQVLFKHYGLIRAWGEVQSLERYDVHKRIWSESQHLDTCRFVRQCGLTVWCEVYDMLRPYKNTTTNTPPYLLSEYNFEFLLQAMYLRPSRDEDPTLDPGTRVRDLNLAEHGEEVLLWFNELLLKSGEYYETMLSVFVDHLGSSPYDDVRALT